MKQYIACDRICGRIDITGSSPLTQMAQLLVHRAWFSVATKKYREEEFDHHNYYARQRDAAKLLSGYWRG